MITPITNGLNKVANSKFVTKHIDDCMKNANFLTGTLLATSVSKDVLAYGLRVNNTKNNKELPEDKKSFVMKMDAVTGVVTALVQFSVGAAVANKKVQEAVSKKLFSCFEEGSKEFTRASAGFKVISTLVASTLFAKRVLVPMISAPIASALDKKSNEAQKGQ